MTTDLLSFTAADVPELAGGAPTGPGAAPSAGVSSFVEQNMPLAQKVSERTGVAPEILLGQWGLETGWGKSVIPGTNNLGNIKDPSGRGARATDNMTGSSDAYMKFATPDAFGEHYAGLIGRRYKTALNTGGDAQRFFTELKTGGYAEDPGYVAKGVRAAGMVSAALGRPAAGAQQPSEKYYARDTTPYIVSRDPNPGAGAMDFFKEVAASAIDSVGSIGQAVGEVGAAALNHAWNTEEFEGKNVLKPASEGVRGTMSEGGKRAREDLPQGDILDPSTWQLPKTGSGLVMTGANAFGSLAPMLVMTIIPGLGEATWAKRAQDAGTALKAAQAAGDAAKIAEAGAALQDAQAALRMAAIRTKTSGAFSEAAMTGGAAAEEVRQTAAKTIAQLSHEDLMEVPAYRSAFERTGDEQQARSATVNSAAQWAGGLSALAGAASGTFNAKVIEDIILHKGIVSSLGKLSDSRFVRAGIGALGGHGIEASQEGLEKFGQNVGENIGLGRPAMQNATRDTFGDVVGGALVGGPMGAVTGGVSSPERKEVIPPGLEKVADKAAEGGTLSKAAMAGNTGPLADAARAAAAQQQGVDPAARLAQLEATAKSGTMLTEQEAAEHQKLTSLKAATAQAAGTAQNATSEAEAKVNEEEAARAADLTQRSAQIATALRKPGALNTLRAKDSPVTVQSVLNDLATAQSPSTDPGRREQALSRLEFALEWAGINTAEKPTAYDNTQAAGQRAQVAQQQDASNQEAAAKLPPQVDVDSLMAALKVEPALRSAEQTNTVKMAQARYQPEDFALLQKNATYAAGLSATEKLRVQQLRGTANPALKVGRDTAAEIAKATAQPAPPAPSTVTAAAPMIPHQGGAQSGGGNVATPAAHRKRRAQLRQIIDMGINRVERREDGFYLSDGKREYKLDNVADAALARAEMQAKIREGAELANTEPTEGQKRAGNYKKGRVEFDGMKLGIENPIGSTRSGTSPGGKPWSVDMTAHYGDLTSTTGADGDGVDIYLAKDARPGSPVFVFDQYKDDGSFDEHKAVLGVHTLEQAASIYDAHFSDGSGPRRRRGVKQMTVDEFKAWANSPAAKKPAAGGERGQAGSVGAGVPARGEGSGSDQQRGGVGVAGAGRAGGDVRVADGGNPGAPARRSGADSPAPDGGVRADVAEVGAGPDNPESGSEIVVPIGKGKERKLKRLQKVDVNLLGNDSPSRGSRKQKITTANGQIIQALAKAFGKEVVFFRDPDGDLGDGFVMPRIDTTLFINEESTVNHLSVFGHELLHLLQRDMPQVHAILRAMVAERIKDGGRGKFRDYYNSTKGAADTELNSDELGEFTSDLGGEFLSDPKFWRDLMDRVKELHPAEANGLIAQLAAKLFAMIDHLVAYIKKQKHAPFATSKLVDDLETIRGAYKEALAQYLSDNGIRKSTMQAQVQKGKTDEVKKSKARDVTQGEAFKKWFSPDSTLVNEDGSPMRLYHGTGAKFTEFKRSTYGAMGPAVYLGDDREVALGYKPEKGGRIMEVYARGKYLSNMEWSKYIGEHGWKGAEAAARADGWDGVHDTMFESAVAVWDPANIKSATKNSGEFSETADITRSKERDNALDETGPGTGGQPEASRGADGDTPRYGTKREGSVSAVGYHFSQQPRKHLDAAHYGTGLKGAERERLTGRENDDIRPRVYFYVDKGKGVNPESGVGGASHAVQLDNLYDVQKDPLGIVKDNPGANSWERAVMRAGFDGYLNMDPILPQGYAVLVGKKNSAVPVKQTNAPGFTAPAKPVEVEKKFESKAVDRNPELANADVEKIPGAKLKYGYLTVPLSSREEANAEMERLGSDVRFSKARDAVIESPQFQDWFEDSQVVDEAGKPLVVFHGTVGDFNSFDRKRAGQTTGADNTKLGFFFTDRADVAGEYARMGGTGIEGQNIMPVLLSLQKPVRLSAANMMEADKLLVQQLRKEHDGAIIKVRTAMGNGGHQTVYMVRDPEQVKSAVGNNGDFSKAEADITRSKARDVTETPAFKSWFGDSKVVGENGQPLRVYHGSDTGNITEFKEGPGGGIYFTSDKGLANHATKYKNGENKTVYPVYLSLQNPATFDYLNRRESQQKALDRARADGHDGLIVKNWPESFDGGDTFIVFNPTQIKSATGNDGSFDPQTADITRSPARISDEDARELGDLRRQLSVLDSIEKCLG